MNTEARDPQEPVTAPVPGNCEEFDCQPGDLCAWLYFMCKLQNFLHYLREKEINQNL